MLATVYDAYLDVRNALRAAGVAGYALEARELLAFALGQDRNGFDERSRQMIFGEACARIDELLHRRLSGQPLAHIIGEWDFYALTFALNEHVLIPRADTETLARCGIEAMRGRSEGHILDLCCGSGCVGIAVLKHVAAGVSAVFVDVSEEALAVTRQNLLRHTLTARGLTVLDDALCPASALSGRYHLIVCNPPYIRTDEMAGLDAEVRHEPRLALDGGEDGLDFYRAVTYHYRSALAEGGQLLFEVGLGQHADVVRIMERAGLKDVFVRHDLSGVERVVGGRA